MWYSLMLIIVEQSCIYNDGEIAYGFPGQLWVHLSFLRNWVGQQVWNVLDDDGDKICKDTGGEMTGDDGIQKLIGFW